MKVKSVIKLFKGSIVHICDRYGGLMVSVYVDGSTGDVYAEKGWSYTNYEFVEGCKVDKIKSPHEDIIIQLK